MKNFVIPILLTCLCISSCQDEELIEPTNKIILNQDDNSKNNQFLSLTTEEFVRMQSEIELTIENNRNNNNQNNLDKIELTNNNIDVLDIIKSHNKLTDKYPRLTNHTSMLDIYHQALLMNKSKLKEFAKKYDNFLVYFKEIDQVMLKVSISKAALLNPDGLIKLDNKIFQFLPNGFKVIESGDENKIDLLSNTNTSNKEITVNLFTNEKVFVLNSGILSPPGNNFYQVAWVHFIDISLNVNTNDCLLCNAIYEYDITFGTNVATFFLGQPNTVSELAVQTTASFTSSCGNLQPVPNSGQDSNGGHIISSTGTQVTTEINCIDSQLFILSAQISTVIAARYANNVIVFGNPMFSI